MKIKVLHGHQELTMLEPECHAVCRRMAALGSKQLVTESERGSSQPNCWVQIPSLSLISSVTLGNCPTFSVCPSSSTPYSSPHSFFPLRKLIFMQGVCSGLTLGSASGECRTAEDRQGVGPDIYLFF